MGQGNISKEEWLQKESSPLSSSLPVWQQAKSMARRRTHQRRTHQRQTHQQRHIANASTPSLRPNQTRHTGETRTPRVDPRGLGFATSNATLTVTTTSLLPVLQGANLP